MKKSNALFEKISIIGISVILLVSGCSRNEDVKIPSPMRSVQTLRLAVPDNLEKECLEQASLFAADVAIMSEGRLNVNVISVPGSISAEEGDYDLAYLSNMEVAKTSFGMETLSLPFLYDSSAHLSLALNSPDVKKTISQRMQNTALPLAALSSGNSVLLTSVDAPRGEMQMPTFMQNLIIGLETGTGVVSDSFQALGAKVVPMSYDKATDFLENRQASVSQTEGAVANSLDITMTQALSASVSRKVFALKTRHTLTPIWFVANIKMWETLSPIEQAIVQEASAGLISRYEEGRARFQSSWEKEMEKRGIDVVQTERQAFAAMLYNADSQSSMLTSDIVFDEQLFLHVQNYS